jgi:hypothetical protein
VTSPVTRTVGEQGGWSASDADRCHGPAGKWLVSLDPSAKFARDLDAIALRRVGGPLEKWELFALIV